LETSVKQSIKEQ